MKKDRWVPLQRATVVTEEPPAAIALLAQRLNISEAEALALAKEDSKSTEYWVNDIYQVQVRRYPESAVHLNIRRRDGNVIFRDWRHFQRIKNQLIGSECEAVELYPAESRLVDTSNKYHLYGVSDPAFRFPFGFTERDVMSESCGPASGLRQRKL